MGASGSSEIGKYQLSTTYEDTQKVVYEIILDTKTGKIVKRSEMKTGEYNKYQYFEY